MNLTLHITNGDCAAVGMRAAGVLGEILPWRDVLHIGPVKSCSQWQEFDQMRAAYLIAVGLGERNYIESSFAGRQTVMNKLSDYESIYLWFEHDLYDQLQLLQVLMCLQTQAELHEKVRLIVSDLYLGTATDNDYHELFRYSEPLNRTHLSVARNYWQALTHHTPELLPELTAVDYLPFMFPAFQRLCAEYPNHINGLSQTENCMLTLLDQTTDPKELFMRYQKTEDTKFMGDSTFSMILCDLINCDSPLVAINNRDISIKHHNDIWQHEICITSTGKNVMLKQLNHLSINQPNKWIGGTHLTSGCMWCYDKLKQQFIKWEN